MTNEPQQVDVVVVGAGIAGLSAARELTAGGRTVAVLESRDQVGGRLRSDEQTGLDLGATWFWPNEPRVMRLVKEVELAVHAQHLAGDAIYHVPGGCQRIDGNPLDAPSFRVSTGMQSLAVAVAAELPEGVIHLDTPVHAVRLDGDAIVADTPRGVVAGRHLVLAVPPATAVHRIEFSPTLPESLADLAAGTPVWMGAITKVVAIYKTPFWRQVGLAGSGISHIGPMREIHDISGPGGQPAALFGFVPRSPGDAAVGEDDIRGQLVEMFGDAAANPQRVIVHDWSDDEHTSPPGVVSLTAYGRFGHRAYAKPALNGRLHWASTETAAQYSGHVEGALVAAARAVRAVLDA